MAPKALPARDDPGMPRIACTPQLRRFIAAFGVDSRATTLRAALDGVVAGNRRLRGGAAARLHGCTATCPTTSFDPLRDGPPQQHADDLVDSHGLVVADDAARVPMGSTVAVCGAAPMVATSGRRWH